MKARLAKLLGTKTMEEFLHKEKGWMTNPMTDGKAVELETQRGKQSTPGTRATPETNPHDRGDRASESDEQCLRALGRQVTVATGLQKAQMLDLLTPSQMAQLSLNDSKAGNGDYMDLNPNPACVSDSDEDEQSQV
ncbi:Hypothetical predicted protein [Xyrichtys novacula]|uniref:Uncharacterized protein n=1 Tax=Xyrichtys novacula TaxID=13765 RepID=A0AAV1ENN8_XYRNO|nr:Hypothetical predicted protein [Xyrichtys novacula]